AGPRRWVTRARDVARVARRTGHGIRAGTGTGLARVGLRAGVTVVAAGAVRGGWARARAARWIACTRRVALVRRRARNRVGPRARAALAAIGLRACVAVVARRAV